MTSVGIEASYLITVLLVGSVALFVVNVLCVTIAIQLWRKSGFLFELLLHQSRRHTRELLEQNEKYNAQLSLLQERNYRQQESASIQQSATVRQLLDSFSIAASGKPLE